MKIFSPILKGTTTVVQGTTNLSGSFTGSLFGTAATASYADNFTVGGTLTAQTINVQIITSSIEFNTGSTRNGALSTNTHQFTGSVLMSGSLGIGTSSPLSSLHISVESGQSTIFADAFGSNVQSIGRVASGTRTSPTTLTTDMLMYAFGARGYNGTDFTTLSTATVTINASETWTLTANGSYITFNTTLSGTTTRLERMRITSAGNVGIGTTTPSARLHTEVAVEGTATGAVALIVKTSNGANDIFRWFDGSTQLGVFKNNGNVGIGITTDNPIGNGGTYRNLLVGNGAGYGVFQGISTATATNSAIAAFSGGTTGASSANKNACSINVELDGTSTTDAIGRLVFYTANSSGIAERMRITSSGSVGIGTSSPSGGISGNELALHLAHSNVSILALQSTAASGKKWQIYSSNDGSLYFRDGTAGTQVFNLQTSGNVLINKTTASGYPLEVEVFSDGNLAYFTRQGANTKMFMGGTTAGATAFYIQSNTTNGVYLTAGGTSWTANSDIRLKNVISPIDSAVDKLTTLNPVIFSWKSDDTNKENIGLIAQDVKEVFPQVIDTNEEGFLGVRYVELIPVLVKAIQELKAENDTLKEILQRNNIQ